MTYDSPPEITCPSESTQYAALRRKRLFDVLGATAVLLLVLPG